MVAVSYTAQAAPKKATASYFATEGKVTVTSGEWYRSAGTTTISATSQPAAAKPSPISPPGDEWSCLTKSTRTLGA
jgi:hypothetical protein